MNKNQLDKLVDLRQYPIQSRNNAQYKKLIESIQSQLEKDGCTILKNFILKDILEQSRNMCDQFSKKAHFNVNFVNPYSSKDDPSLPPEHPIRYFMERSNGFVSKDIIPNNYPLLKLYHNPFFQWFIADCLKEPEIYEYADPLAGFVVNVIRPGCQQEWHFDTNEFIVSIMTQKAEKGGKFLYCPNIRTNSDERYDQVGAILMGKNPHLIQELDLYPGNLQIFKGRFTLHRVTKVEAKTDRHTSIFGYTKKPDQIGQLERTLKLFGKALPIHYEINQRK